MKIVVTWMIALFMSQGVFATDMTPWLTSTYELHADTGVLLQRYTKIDAGNHTINDDNTGQLYFTGLRGAKESLSFEVELFLTNTKHRSFGFSHATETVRYQFSDDVIGDSYSAVVGASLSQVTTRSVNDVTFINHGNFEGILFLSYGKELSSSWTNWCQRVFGVAGVGVASTGSPWIQGGAYYEFATPERHIIGVGSSFEWGFGNKNVHLYHFHGYGRIQYRELNLEGYYSYAFDRDSSIKVAVDTRVVAKNCPQSVAISFMYLATFGL